MAHVDTKSIRKFQWLNPIIHGRTQCTQWQWGMVARCYVRLVQFDSTPLDCHFPVLQKKFGWLI